MQKKLLALAVAAAVSSPAFADNANVTVYGKVVMDLEHVSSNNVGVNAAGAKVSGSQNRVVSNASRLGFKGKEDLGDGLSAIFQYEAEYSADGNGATGPFVGTRNSQVGLDGGFGTVFLGNWDTPYKQAHNPVELFDNATFASTTDLLGRLDGGALSLNTRLKDSVNYYTPNMGGFQVKAAYGVDDAQTTATTTPAATSLNQTVTSLSAAFENEMFYAALAYQAHNDNANNAAATGNKTTGTRLVGAFKFDKDSLVGVTVEKLSAKVAATGITSSRTAVEVSGKASFGAHNIGAAVVRAGDMTAGAATVKGATQVALRYGYSLSKRTELFAMLSQVKNGTGATVATSGNYGFSASSSVTNSQRGATQNGLGVGLVMNF